MNDDTVIGRMDVTFDDSGKLRYIGEREIRLSDLAEQYRKLLFYAQENVDLLKIRASLHDEQEARIAELEARLAKAEAALEEARHEQEVLRDQRDTWRDAAREAMKDE